MYYMLIRYKIRTLASAWAGGTGYGVNFFLVKNTLAAHGLEKRRNFKELLTESVGRVHFS
jgi:hypothetical protein